jgi:hypothetical protein
MVLEGGGHLLVFLDVTRLIIERRDVGATCWLTKLMMIVSVVVSGRLVANLQRVLLRVSGLILDLVKVDVSTVQERVRVTGTASRRLLITETLLLGRFHLVGHLTLQTTHSRLLLLHVLVMHSRGMDYGIVRVLATERGCGQLLKHVSRCSVAASFTQQLLLGELKLVLGDLQVVGSAQEMVEVKVGVLSSNLLKTKHLLQLIGRLGNLHWLLRHISLSLTSLGGLVTLSSLNLVARGTISQRCLHELINFHVGLLDSLSENFFNLQLRRTRLANSNLIVLEALRRRRLVR